MKHCPTYDSVSRPLSGARKKGSRGRDSRRTIVHQLLYRDGPWCHLCGKEIDTRIRDEAHPGFLTLDHIVPASQGGAYHRSNLRLAHRACNGERGDRPAKSVPTPPPDLPH